MKITHRTKGSEREFIPKDPNRMRLFYSTAMMLVAFIAIGLAGCSTVNNVQNTTNTPETEKEENQISPEITEIGQTALYIGFTQERYSELLGKKPFVLFFHAPWCPTCVELEKQINQNIKNLPKETIILKADYDTETKLKRDYGVTVQSTLVVIDQTGKVTQLLLSPSFDQLKAAISASL